MIIPSTPLSISACVLISLPKCFSTRDTLSMIDGLLIFCIVPRGIGSESIVSSNTTLHIWGICVVLIDSAAIEPSRNYFINGNLWYFEVVLWVLVDAQYCCCSGLFCLVLGGCVLSSFRGLGSGLFFEWGLTLWGARFTVPRKVAFFAAIEAGIACLPGSFLFF